MFEQNFYSEAVSKRVSGWRIHGQLTPKESLLPPVLWLRFFFESLHDDSGYGWELGGLFDVAQSMRIEPKAP